MRRLPKWMTNKYLLSGAGFLLWVLFFDERDLITTQFKHRVELKRLETSKKYYSSQIAATQQELEGLRRDPVQLEKYAREKYLMQRDNEDVFVISPR